jgi:hypothetical protein
VRDQGRDHGPAGGGDAGGGDAGGGDAGGEDAGGEDAGGEDAGGEDADGEDADGEDAGGEDADGEDADGVSSTGWLAARRLRNHPRIPKTMSVPMTAERRPPQSKISVSPMPSPRVKITYPTRAPSRPAPRETAHEAGPLIFLKKSRGISTRAITPATKPKRIAPSIRIHLSVGGTHAIAIILHPVS